MSGSLDLSPIYEAAGQNWNVDPKLLQSVVRTESGENPATPDSSAGAQGVAQFMPATAKAIGVQNPYDPVQAIYGAAKLLSQNLDHYGNVPDALRAYNAGTDPSRWNNPETAAYVPKVAAHYAALSAPAVNPAAGMDLTPHPDPAQGSDDFFAQTAAAPGTPASADDFFAQTAGAQPSSAAPATATPAVPQSPEDFFKATTAGASASPSAAPDVPSDPGVLSHIAAGLKTSAQGAESLFYGAGNWANKNLPGPDLDIVDTAGAAQQSADEVKAANAGDKTWAYTGGKLLGDAAIGAPMAALGGALAAPIAGAAGIGEGATLGGRLAYQGIKGALEGASAAGATSGSNPNQSLGAQVGFGAVGGGALGAAVPAAAAGIGAARNALMGDAADSATAQGVNRLAPSYPAIDASDIKTPADAQAAAAQIVQKFATGGPTDISPSATSLPGVAFNAAEATGNPGLGSLVKSLRSQNGSPAQNVFSGIKATNDAARTAIVDGITGTPADIEAAEAERDAVTSAARNTAFSNPQPVDAAPVVQKLDDLISANQGRPTVQTPMNWIRDQLVTTDPETGQDTLTSDPQQLYNVRKYIGDIIAPRARGTAADGTAAAAQLTQLKPVLDDAIETGAPGFKNYISQYDQLSQPINAMQWLQQQKLTDSMGNVTLSKLDSTIKSAQAQQALGGARLPNSISDSQMQGLMDLRNHMQDAAAATYNGKLPGSDTAQNLASAGLISNMLTGGNIGRTIGAGAGMLAGHPHLGATVGGMLGNAAASQAAGRTALAAAKGNSMVQNALLDALTDPEYYQNALNYRPPVATAGAVPTYFNALAGVSAPGVRERLQGP